MLSVIDDRHKSIKDTVERVKYANCRVINRFYESAKSHWQDSKGKLHERRRHTDAQNERKGRKRVPRVYALFIWEKSEKRSKETCAPYPRNIYNDYGAYLLRVYGKKMKESIEEQSQQRPIDSFIYRHVFLNRTDFITSTSESIINIYRRASINIVKASESEQIKVP